MFGDESGDFQVVVNHLHQMSIWRASEAPPDGWSAAGCSGSRVECLDFIDANWHDLRPGNLAAGPSEV